MKIVIIHPHSFFVHPWTCRIKLIAKAFLELGHKPVIFHFNYSGEKVYTFDENIKLVDLEPGYKYFFRNLYELRKELKDEDILYFCKQVRDSVLTGLLASIGFKIKTHIDFEDFESRIASESGVDKIDCIEQEFYEKVLVRLCDYVSFSSYYTASKLNIKNKKYFYLPALVNNLKNNHKIERNKRINIVYFGQGVSVCAYERFIKAAEILGKEYSELYFKLILSLVKDKQKILDKTRKITNLKIEFDVDDNRLYSILDESQIAFLPFEDTPAFKGKSPNKVLESINCGLLTVSNDIGEVSRFINDKRFLCKPDIIDECDILKKIILNYDYYRQEFENVITYVRQEFDYKLKVKKLIDFWNENK